MVLSFLPRLVLDCDPPASISHVAGITDVYCHAQTSYMYSLQELFKDQG
jgi:hypothetical protein